MNATRARKLLVTVQATGIPGYRVDTLLGHGGSAAVFMASDSNQAQYALKIYDPDLTDQVDRLDRELSLAGHGCKHLVQIFAGGKVVVDGDVCVYVVMEFVPGIDLNRRISLDDRFDDSTIRRLLLQLHETAQFLLSRGFCHRDIKPANIRLRTDDNLVLLDLGVIRPVTGSDLTDNDGGRRFIATRRYTPPELQHRTHEESTTVWEAITVYQIGGVLYELIHGALLFAHVPDQPPADLVVAVDQVQPQVFRSDVGPDLLSLTRACLLKEPGARLQHASMVKIRECGSAAWSDELATQPMLDKYFLEAATRHESEILSRENRLEVAKRQRMANWVAAGGVVSSALDTLPNSIRSSPVYNGPGDGDGAIYVALCGDDISKRIVSSLRIAILVYPSPQSEFVAVRGLAFRGTIDSDSLHLTMRLIERNELIGFLENIWERIYEASSLRIATNQWISKILTRYFEDTTAAYEARMAEEVRYRDIRLSGGAAPVGRMRREPLFAFNSSGSRPAKDWFP